MKPWNIDKRMLVWKQGKPLEYYWSNTEMQNVNQLYYNINMLSYSVAF